MRSGLIKALLPLMVAGAWLAPVAGAVPDPEFGKGCDTTPTGSLIDQFGYRTICDGYIREDGSWERQRIFWGRSNRVCVPTATFRRCTDLDDVPRHVYSKDVYDVRPETIPFGEPGWIE
ncbi:hypothetical protein KIH27_01595 [Mycobacterium sp. M1]|uniref:CDGP domain-containing protein n=1 Tax=Mycolicibacter acidiphilus TaxID=2835306 RepID=A0ABS5RH43_9MYCO|nr:hypothetical protein [Mycolicibacter acidiphilus]MBS9532279.1 hypothetical protein [Mycolicibacter acidiphilus]